MYIKGFDSATAVDLPKGIQRLYIHLLEFLILTGTMHQRAFVIKLRQYLIDIYIYIGIDS